MGALSVPRLGQCEPPEVISDVLKSGDPTCRKRMETLRAEVGVAAQHFPVLVPGDKGNLFNGETCPEQSTGRFVVQIMKTQILDAQSTAVPSECRADRASVVGEDSATIAHQCTLFFDQRASGSGSSCLSVSEARSRQSRHQYRFAPAPADRAGYRSARHLRRSPTDLGLSEACSLPKTVFARPAQPFFRMLQAPRPLTAGSRRHPSPLCESLQSSMENPRIWKRPRRTS